MKTDFFNRQGLPEPVLMLAPMEGITNRHFRGLVAKAGGVDVVATEFVRITGQNQKVKPFFRHNVPLQIQLMSADPEVLAEAILFSKKRGIISDNDWIDLNVGCPSRRVNARGAGAALLLEPEKLIRMTEAMRGVHPGPLSLKTRVGYQGDEAYPEILGALAKCPIDFIAIHARTRCAKYEGTINLDYLSQAVAALPYPVIGNGEIKTAKDALEMIETTGVSGIMCGRGAVSDPFLFRNIKEERSTNFAELVEFNFELMDCYRSAEKKPNQMLGVFKEFGVWLSKNPLIGKEYFAAIKRASTFEEVYNSSKNYLANLSETKHVA